ncbi:glycosyl hydrolase family 18 protein [Microbulbifer sp. OS29]|uniref:Glycosyl hydrolase family 18 protein n=1 Tax=Microbulbifer okhotskensis TaxID=2926617 RepID=A0A9X2EMU5_9GAMM|nr:glycosyl hydrolase family 18 protein [Microbulbifer okhotskensis]MCO1334495.1 glycosyl hydrolase family 18 protein [Microbulbifer okhotskensis]
MVEIDNYIVDQWSMLLEIIFSYKYIINVDFHMKQQCLKTIQVACVYLVFQVGAYANIEVVNSDVCPSTASAVSYAEALNYPDDFCALLSSGDVVGLSSGASIEKVISSCQLSGSDGRQLTKMLCKSQPSTPHIVSGSSCASDTNPVTYIEAQIYSDELCSLLGNWEIANLAGNASMDGSGYGCGSRKNEVRTLGATLCKSDVLQQSESLPKVAYVEVNNNDIANAGCFTESDGSQLFDIAIIFAANINYDGQKAILHFNDQVSELLDNNLSAVQDLQAKGAQVVLSVLGNQQNAGWSCFADEQSADDFAQQLKEAVDQYGLDGIDIDDEYSQCSQTYSDSLVKVTSALREKMPNKIISKALWSDTDAFQAEWNGKKLGDQLTYGWEMSYWQGSSCTSRIQKYINLGVDKSKLGVGASTVLNSATAASALATCNESNALGGGTMIFNVTKDSVSYLSTVWPGTTEVPNCLQ